MPLKPQDVLLALHLAQRPIVTWTYARLSESLGISLGELHNAVGRLQSARLVGKTGGLAARLNFAGLEEFLIHGVKYAFAAERGGRTRGMPTGAGAPPLSALMSSPESEVAVWPDVHGMVWGYELTPLYKTVPYAAQRNPELYELLALVDSIRGGGARERKLAEECLRDRLRKAKGSVLL